MPASQSGADIRRAIAQREAAAKRPVPEPVTPEITPEAITEAPRSAAKNKKEH